MSIIYFEWERRRFEVVHLKAEWFESHHSKHPSDHHKDDYSLTAARTSPPAAKRWLKHVPFAWIHARSPDDSPSHDFLMPTDGTGSYLPLIEAPALFLEFAQLSLNDNSICDFASRYGRLSKHQGAETIQFWRSAITKLRAGVQTWKANRLDKLTELFAGYRALEAKVRFGRVRNEAVPRLYVEPSDLLGAMWLQLAQAVGRIDQFHSCRWCKDLFFVGPGSGRTAKAIYCSDRCRRDAHVHGKEGKQ